MGLKLLNKPLKLCYDFSCWQLELLFELLIRIIIHLTNLRPSPFYSQVPSFTDISRTSLWSQFFLEKKLSVSIKLKLITAEEGSCDLKGSGRTLFCCFKPRLRREYISFEKNWLHKGYSVFIGWATKIYTRKMYTRIHFRWGGAL